MFAGAGAAALCERGVDAVKVGQGPAASVRRASSRGRACRRITAISECARLAERSRAGNRRRGIKYSGESPRRWRRRACVMIGSLFAGTDESPARRFLYEGAATRPTAAWVDLGDAARQRHRTSRSSGEARSWSPRARGMVPYKGQVGDTIFQLAGGCARAWA